MASALASRRGCGAPGHGSVVQRVFGSRPASRLRLHLRATVPNEGARRLAWFIAERRDLAFGVGGAVLTGIAASIAQLARDIGRDPAFVDRIIEGELVPGGELAGDIGRATGGAIGQRAWRQAARGGWFERPARLPLPAPLQGVR